MAGTVKTNEVILQSPNGLVEKTISLGNDGAFGGVVGKSTIVSATLASASWTGSSAPYSYSLSVNGATSTNLNEVFLSTSVTLSQLNAFQNANIIDGGQGTNYIILKSFGVKPTIDIPIRVLVRSDL